MELQHSAHNPPRPNEACWCGSGEKYKRCHKEVDAKTERDLQQRTEATRVRKGVVSPWRTVPDSIPAPDYAKTGTPKRAHTRDVRTPEEIVRMRRAGKAAAQILRVAGEAVKPGVTTDDIDAIVHALTLKLGGYPSTLNYREFPKSLCTSVNEVICHGIPDSRPLLEGDIVNCDITIFLDGVHGDCNATFAVGKIDDESARLIRVTRECLEKGIAAVKPGRPISDIGRAIEPHAEAAGFGVVRTYCGHGICDIFHTALQVPHYYDPSARTEMKVGMTFTIEPMITVGTWQAKHWDDGWTVVTADLKRSAQFEHTILVTEAGAEILTVE
jgi:methionyl aminopeptidase